MSDLEPLSGQDAELIIGSDTKEKVFSAKPTNTPESMGSDNIKKQCTRFFAPAGRIGAFLGAVKAEDIKITKTTTVFRPY